MGPFEMGVLMMALAAEDFQTEIQEVVQDAAGDDLVVGIRYQDLLEYLVLGMELVE